MYNARYILAGLALFVLIFSSPFWLNLLSPEYQRPALALPTSEENCVDSLERMRSSHMKILDEWRGLARNGQRFYTDRSGQKREISLQKTCLGCHADKANFCDACHRSHNVRPACWDCHVEPQGVHP